MSATQTGDKPRRRRAPKEESMGVERDLGRLDEAVSELSRRADRSERATQDRFASLETTIKENATSNTAQFKILADGQQKILLAMNAQTARRGVWAFLLGRIEFVIGVSTGLLGVWLSKVWH